MAATTPHVPDISETDLERSDLEEAARDLDIDFDDETDDQTLLERIGVAMGEIDPDDLQDADDESDEDQDEDEEPTAEDAGDEDEDDEADDVHAPAAEAEEAEDENENDEDDEAEDPTAEDEGDDEAEDDAPAAEADDTDDEAEDDAPAAEADDTDDEAEDDAPAAEADDADDDESEDGTDDGDRSPVHEEGEYRFEEDPREGIEPVLDLEMGPVALDVLGVEVHLRRVHAVLTANPNGRRNVVGKLLAGLVKLIDQGGDEDEDEDEDGGMLEKVTSPVRGLARSVKDTVTKD